MDTRLTDWIFLVVCYNLLPACAIALLVKLAFMHRSHWRRSRGLCVRCARPMAQPQEGDVCPACALRTRA